MGSKPKARTTKSKKKSLPSRKSETTKTQAERFIEAARSVGVDETGKEFESALDKIAASRNSPRRPANK